MDEAKLALRDTGTLRADDGTVAASYAHPFFWAPYTLVGDDGG